MSIHSCIMIFDISIQPKCVSIQYHCLMYHDMVWRLSIYCCIQNEIKTYYSKETEISTFVSKH